MPSSPNKGPGLSSSSPGDTASTEGSSTRSFGKKVNIQQSEGASSLPASVIGPTVITVDPDHTGPRRRAPAVFTWKTFSKFVGPGYMVAIGYLDPGNWATDLAAGSEYGYRLLYIILLANLMAVLLQYLCIKLGVVTNRDLAQACRRHFHPWANLALYVLCELAIIATDVAEVVGTAIALKLLFGIPLPYGVCITALDVLVILVGWDVKHLKLFEGLIIVLMMTCGLCFAILVGKSNPDWSEVAKGFLPTTSVLRDPGELYIAVGIIGATVMPHNLYLHSSIVKYRSTGKGDTLGDICDIDELDSDVEDTGNMGDSASSLSSLSPPARPNNLPLTLKLTNLDSVLALTFALAINAAILIVSSANFFGTPESGGADVAELEDAYELLKQYLGWSAGTLFAVALLFAGQSSTITGTMAGQIIMEGFLGSDFTLVPWLRRLVTRVLAIGPSLAVAILQGDQGVNNLLVLSQVVLSVQLAFAVWPLVYFTSSARIMTVSIEPTSPITPFPPSEPGQSGDCCRVVVSYANSTTVTIASVVVAFFITVFNALLLIQIARGET
ncbi:natural resistance-associated macrophage protein-domain-containing protein [Powellomyces hirtus]|nr:natural resistance-associated macrophage protein-domain-containing protein [Powellomyces hirtus]